MFYLLRMMYMRVAAVARNVVQWIRLLPESPDWPSLLLHSSEPPNPDGPSWNHFQFRLGECEGAGCRHNILAKRHQVRQITILRVARLVPIGSAAGRWLVKSQAWVVF